MDPCLRNSRRPRRCARTGISAEEYKRSCAGRIHEAGNGSYFEVNIAAISQEYLGLEKFGLERGTISWDAAMLDALTEALGR